MTAHECSALMVLLGCGRNIAGFGENTLADITMLHTVILRYPCHPNQAPVPSLPRTAMGEPVLLIILDLSRTLPKQARIAPTKAEQGGKRARRPLRHLSLAENSSGRPEPVRRTLFPPGVPITIL